MTPPTDPILKALQQGDEQCPDGRALAKLGRLTREHGGLPRSVDLLSRIKTGLAEGAYADEADTSFEATVHAHYDGGQRDSSLSHFQEQVQEQTAPPADIDLVPRLEGRMSPRRSSRRLPVQPLDGAARFRIWTAVIAGHVAALVAIAAIYVTFRDARMGDPAPMAIHPMYGGSAPYLVNIQRFGQQPAEGAMALEHPASWRDLEGRGDLIMVLRTTPERRQLARELYLTQESLNTTRAALAWLVQRRRTDGTIGTPGTDPSEALAAQSLAALALLGEGVDNPERLQTIRPLLAWIGQAANADHLDSRGRALAALALVEGYALTNDPDLKDPARHGLQRWSQETLGAMDVGGVQTFGYLAWNIAKVTVPELVEDLEAPVLKDTPAQGPGRAASQWLRLLEGHRVEASLIDGLTIDVPTLDEQGRADPLTWYFVGSLLRDTQPQGWQAWVAAHQRALLEVINYGTGRVAWVNPAKVQQLGAMGDDAEVMATALVALNLQIAYRYLPLGG